jgi:DNA-binding LytR/AlgR family response regulator
MNTVPTALIAEDEPLLAQALQRQLALAWPELRIVDLASDGAAAVTQALTHQPQVLFFDVQMPEMGGLEAAAQIAEEWPTEAQSPPFPLLVFVTAYDHYALQAFEAQAVDYVLKPVQPERLMRTVQRVKTLLEQRASQGHESIDETLAQLRKLLPQVGTSPERLHVIQASVGASIYLLPIEEVVYFEAADKYVRVITAARECLIRTPLRELLAQLDAAQFWQIHRGTVVRATAIERVTRDEFGKLSLSLHGRSEALVVSKLYADRFRAM